jgi:hypothetical protein
MMVPAATCNSCHMSGRGGARVSIDSIDTEFIREFHRRENTRPSYRPFGKLRPALEGSRGDGAMLVGCGRISGGWLDAAPLARAVSSAGISMIRGCARARRFDPSKFTVGSWPWTVPQSKRPDIVFPDTSWWPRVALGPSRPHIPAIDAWNWTARPVRMDGTGRLLFPVGSERGPKR